MTKVIGVISQKGGVGKSTLTSLIANYMMEQKEEFVVIDLDFRQKSLANKRDREVKKGKDDSQAYDIIKTNSVNFKKIYLDMIEGEFEYVLIDIPGNFEQAGIQEAVSFVDIAILPTHYSESDFDSFIQTIGFLNEVDELRSDKGYEKMRRKAVLNKINKVSLGYKEMLEKKEIIGEKFGVEWFDTDVAQSEKLQTGFSTVELSAEIRARKDALAFIKEAYTFIKEG